VAGTESANAFLSHLETRRFSPATVRAYAFDIVCLARFLEERGIGLGDLVPADVFDWIDWESLPGRRGGKVIRCWAVLRDRTRITCPYLAPPTRAGGSLERRLRQAEAEAGRLRDQLAQLDAPASIPSADR
jgi:Phage integrase, N-terminal SAM-like domain